MRRHFEEVEEELKNRLLYMGSRAEAMIHWAVQALSERQESYLKQVSDSEAEVNKLHIEVDDRCFKLIALHQPAAGDLRFIMAASKINSDLERIADQAVNIAETTQVLLGQPAIEGGLSDITRMADLAKAMLKDALDAFVKKDVELARSVIARDDEEDKLKSHAFYALMQIMQSDSSKIQRALGLILVSRNLERIADHATNIAEDVVFMVQGKDIRHHSEESEENKVQ